MRTLVAFLQRDWIVNSSYRLSFVMGFAQLFFNAGSFFFIGKLVDSQSSPTLAPYGGAYFPFVLLGLAFSQYLSVSLSSLGGTIREDQLQGTLEAMLATPTPPAIIVLGGVLWNFLRTTFEVGLYLGVGAVIFGLDLGQMNVPASLVLLVLAILSLSSLGVLAAGGILLFKEFDPVSWLLGGMMKLLGGVYFPVALLPNWLEPLARIFPLTYALEGLRQAVLMGRSLQELWQVCVILAIFSLVLWPLALVCFSWTLKRLKTTGALSFR